LALCSSVCISLGISWLLGKYLRMPERVKKLEGQILGFSSQVEDLRGDVHQLVQVLKEAVAPKENDAVPLKDGKYIS